MEMKEAIIQYEGIPSGGYRATSWKPLVRCKDCKFSNKDPRNRIYREGMVLCEKTDHGRDENWFCADGVRKEGR